MRIISGIYKGKNIMGYQMVGTRPTMDRVKESLLAMLQPYLKDSTCLDLFAGSGSLGFEALSNGARNCYFVDSNSIAIQTLRENSQALGIQEEVYFMNVRFEKALKQFSKQGLQFNLIFLDPPYQENLLKRALFLLEEYQLVKEHGVVVCEYETEQFTCSYELLKERTYGSKRIRIYQKNT